MQYTSIPHVGNLSTEIKVPLQAHRSDPRNEIIRHFGGLSTYPQSLLLLQYYTSLMLRRNPSR